MKLSLLIGCITCCCTVQGQNYLLPFVRQGKWQLIDTNGALVVSTPYSYIHTYDNKGFTYFHTNAGYGILNDQGKEVVAPVYEDVQQLGNGNYVLKNNKGWIRFQSGQYNTFASIDTLESYEHLHGTWAITGKKDSLFLLNQASGKSWKLKDSTANIRQLHDHVLLEYNDTARYQFQTYSAIVFQQGPTIPGKLRCSRR